MVDHPRKTFVVIIVLALFMALPGCIWGHDNDPYSDAGQPFLCSAAKPCVDAGWTCNVVRSDVDCMGYWSCSKQEVWDDMIMDFEQRALYWCRDGICRCQSSSGGTDTPGQLISFMGSCESAFELARLAGCGIPSGVTADDQWRPGPGSLKILAGTGARGSTNGPSWLATLTGPHGLAITGGKVFVAGPKVVRQIHNGVVSSTATETTYLGRPRGLAADSAGNVYIADPEGNRIWKLSTFGKLSVLAGDGYPGSADGSTASARFSEPMDVAVGAQGRIFVADAGNHRIRMIDGGQVSTVAGRIHGFVDGPAPLARFHRPMGIEVDATGRILVADTLNFRIRMIDGGQVSTVAGGPVVGSADGAAGSARFAHPVALTVDSAGRIFVADDINRNIRSIVNGVVSTLVTSQQLGLPSDVAVDSKGRLLISDQGRHKVLVYRFSGGQV